MIKKKQSDTFDFTQYLNADGEVDFAAPEDADEDEVFDFSGGGYFETREDALIALDEYQAGYETWAGEDAETEAFFADGIKAAEWFLGI